MENNLKTENVGYLYHGKLPSCPNEIDRMVKDKLIVKIDLEPAMGNNLPDDEVTFIAKAMAFKGVGDPNAVDIKGQPRWKWYLTDAQKYCDLFNYKSPYRADLRPSPADKAALDEYWKPHPRHTKYQVSSLGRIKSTRGDVMSPHKSNGYLGVLMDRKKVLVHAAVMETFVGPKPEGYCVAHLDGTRDNNQLGNLKYCTNEENVAHKREHGTRGAGESGPGAKLTADQVIALRVLKPLVKDGKVTDFYACFDLHDTTIKRAISGISHGDLDGCRTFEGRALQADAGLVEALEYIAAYEIKDSLNYYNARAMIEKARAALNHERGKNGKA